MAPGRLLAGRIRRRLARTISRLYRPLRKRGRSLQRRTMKTWRRTAVAYWWRKRGRRLPRRVRKLVHGSRPVRWWRSKRKLRRSIRKALKKAYYRVTVGERDRRRLRSAGALTPLRAFCRARPRGALPPDYTDLWFLYREVRRRRPETLLEFGSGCSTVVLAFALRQNGAGHLWSLESDKGWSAATTAALPDSLRPVVTLVHAPVREDDRDVQGWSYTNRPAVAPDLVYLDGPALTRERKVAFDVLDLEPALRPGCVVIVDGRGENVRYLEARLTRPHSFVVLPPWRSVFEFDA
jgi:hypothetical protein